MKRKSRKTFDIVMSTKSIFLKLRFEGGGVQPGTSSPSPFGAPMIISAAYKGIGSLEGTQTETAWK